MELNVKYSVCTSSTQDTHTQYVTELPPFEVVPVVSLQISAVRTCKWACNNLTFFRTYCIFWTVEILSHPLSILQSHTNHDRSSDITSLWLECHLKASTWRLLSANHLVVCTGLHIMWSSGVLWWTKESHYEEQLYSSQQLKNASPFDILRDIRCFADISDFKWHFDGLFHCWQVVRQDEL